MSDLTFTTIEESARKQLSISRDEYAVCNYIQTWAAHPSNKTPGFCNRTRGQMAEFVGITERGLQKMLSRLEGLDLIKRPYQSQFLYRITERWFDIVVAAKAERTGEQSSRQGVNKVPGRGEQSSRQGVNKVPTHKEYNKEVNNQQQKDADAAELLVKSTTEIPGVTLVEKFNLEAETQKAPPVAPHPPSPPRWDSFDIDKASEEIKANPFSAENFARITGCQATTAFVQLALEVDVFVLEQKAKQTKYNRFDEFSSHFFNYERAKVRAGRNGVGTQQKQNYTTSTIPLSLQNKIGR